MGRRGESRIAKSEISDWGCENSKSRHRLFRCFNRLGGDSKADVPSGDKGTAAAGLRGRRRDRSSKARTLFGLGFGLFKGGEWGEGVRGESREKTMTRRARHA